MNINSNFKPAKWLTNGHLQTIYPKFINHQTTKIDYYERLELPDGDFVDLAWSTHGLNKEAPLVVLLHGLGGGVNSSYVSQLLKAFNHNGYRAVLMLFRGAGSEPNRLPRAYHSGDTADLAYLLQHLHHVEPHTKKAAVGVSLGGNVLLKYLGETGTNSLIDAAVAVSVPFELDQACKKMNKGFSRIYQFYLLKGLRSLFLKKLDLVKDSINLTRQELLSLNTLLDFDERITAPLHGFKNAADYYQKSSSKQYLSSITTPTLIIHAADDPFMTPAVIPTNKELSPNTQLELSTHGGHVGFIAENQHKKPTYWLSNRIPLYLKNYL